MTYLKCNCCGRSDEDVVVCGSRCGALSLAYCRECFSLGIEPYDILVAYASCGVNSYDELNDAYKALTDRTLKFYNKTIDDFNADIKKVNDEWDRFAQDHNLEPNWDN